MLSATRPEAPSAFTAAVHDCAGVHGAHQHPHGPSASSQAAAGTVEEEGSGQPCPAASLLAARRHISSKLLWPPGYQPNGSLQPTSLLARCWETRHAHPAQPTGSMTAACPEPQAPLLPSGRPLVLCCPRGTACCSSPQPTHTDFIPAWLVSPGCHKHP